MSKNKDPYYCVQEIFAFKKMKGRIRWVHTLMKYSVQIYALNFVIM